MNWKVFASCLFLALALWLIVSLNQNYTTSKLVKVNYLNKPSAQVFVRPLPEAFKLIVYGKGWDLLWLLMRSSSKEVVIDLKNYASRNFILSRRLQNGLQQQLSSKLSITEIQPDTVFLQKEPRRFKKVPVHLNLAVSFKNHFALGDQISYAPDSVVISGPKALIDTIKNAETERILLDHLSQPATVDVPLIGPPQRNLTFSLKKITVKIPVYALTEQLLEIPVEVINKRVRHEIRLIPSRVSVSYQAPVNLYDHIKAGDFELVVDGSAINPSDSSRKPLKLQLISQPHFIYNLRLKQEYVDYLLER